ncbi:putative vascular cell adhesion protein 1, partial [Triplophysa rosa]
SDVSITTVNHTGPVIESHQYRLQCHIPNVVQATSVKWYKKQSLVYQESLDINKTPELTIVPNRTDDGAQYRCEAELNAGPFVPQRLKQLTSDLLSITVHFKPTINGTNLPTKVPVFRGYPLVLVCEAEGNPKPTVSWSQTNPAVNGGNLTITELISQNPVCTAINIVGSTSRNITVVPTEDYLPLIAGLVAVTVAIISVIFVFIFSIYYKTAKTGHYSLKDAKPSPQNGNIAQNGKDNPLHMKKLSQSDILAYP